MNFRTAILFVVATTLAACSGKVSQGDQPAANSTVETMSFRDQLNCGVAYILNTESADDNSHPRPQKQEQQANINKYTGAETSKGVLSFENALQKVDVEYEAALSSTSPSVLQEINAVKEVQLQIRVNNLWIAKPKYSSDQVVTTRISYGSRTTTHLFIGDQQLDGIKVNTMYVTCGVFSKAAN